MKVLSNLMVNNSKIKASEIAFKDSNDNINTLDTILNNKNYKYINFSNISCNANVTNTLATLTLPEGIWVVVGAFTYDSSNLRYYLNIDNEAAVSIYDNAGNVAGNISAIINVTTEKNISLTIWPNKAVTLSGKLRAVKYL